MSRFSRQFNHKFHYAEPDDGGSNQWGDRAYGDPVEAKCRYVESDEDVTDQDGSIVASRDVIRTEAEVSDEAIIWPPGADTTDVSQARESELVKPVPSVRGGTVIYRIEL